MNSAKFRQDLSLALFPLGKANTLGQSMEFYNDAVVNVLDTHAPKKTSKFRVVENAPRFDNEYLNLRKERRRAEKKYQKTKAEDDKKAYLLLQKKATEIVKNKKKKLHNMQT